MYGTDKYHLNEVNTRTYYLMNFRPKDGFKWLRKIVPVFTFMDGLGNDYFPDELDHFEDTSAASARMKLLSQIGLIAGGTDGLSIGHRFVSSHIRWLSYLND